MNKFFILLIKYMPIIQMVAMLLNNTMYCFDVYTKMYYLLGYLAGNSIMTTILLYVCSYVFKFCSWYRLIVTANLINLTLGIVDIYIKTPMIFYKYL